MPGQIYRTNILSEEVEKNEIRWHVELQELKTFFQFHLGYFISIITEVIVCYHHVLFSKCQSATFVFNLCDVAKRRNDMHLLHF